MQLKTVLLKKFYQGDCTESELHQLFDLLTEEDDPASELILEQLAAAMPTPPPLDQAQKARIYDKVLASIGEEQAEGITVRSSWTRYWYSGIAASFLILVASLGWWYAGSGSAERLYQTQAGQILELMLPDSSMVTLNGNSQLRFPQEWDHEGTRYVRLTGEAYFHVKPKLATKAKFQVLTNDLTVEVLGTAFNVNSREAETKVFLDEGKVKVKLEAAEEIEMAPGELLSYSHKAKQSLLTQQEDSELHTSWKRGVMAFKDTPLAEIIRILEAAHDIRIHINDETLGARKYTFSLPIDDMDVTRSMLERMTGGKLVPEADHYLLRKK
ncbi:MAG: FecR domain-containing protein [Bacteroidota bacterium]